MDRLPIRFDALLNSNDEPNPDCDGIPLMHQAEVIVGVDTMSRHQFMLYDGLQEGLDAISDGVPERQVAAVFIELDQDTEELFTMLALVELLKGRHDYDGPLPT